MTVLLLALNEVNFEHVQAYVRAGKLPVLGDLIARHGVAETTSEAQYHELEPWIQWVTAHTGLSLAEHGVFRLGDIVHKDIPQIWEILEAQGKTVGAICPMNAKNRCVSPAFFIPDPWTDTAVTGSVLQRKFYQAVSRSVNENAVARVSLASSIWLALGMLRYARPSNYRRYLKLTESVLHRRSWAKALLLDQILADMFVRLVRKSSVDFGSLFLNAAAHIQHHYMFNAQVYDGDQSNPDWYISASEDPVLEVYEIYDAVVGQVREVFPEARLILATGLHQNPHPECTFYWRLRDHEAFLSDLDIIPSRVQPLMSRDFVIHFPDAGSASVAERRLSEVRAGDGSALFDIDNRGESLFVMLTWPHDIPDHFHWSVGDERRSDLRRHVAFVAIKNGSHDGIGYVVDTGAATVVDERFHLKKLPAKLAAACGAAWPSDETRPAMASAA